MASTTDTDRHSYEIHHSFLWLFSFLYLLSSYQLYFVFAGGILSSLDIYVIHSDFDDLMRKMQFMVQSSNIFENFYYSCVLDHYS